MTSMDNVRAFFALLGKHGSQDVTEILKLFVGDNDAAGPPNIGLTTGNKKTAGPQFNKVVGIMDLFSTLQNSFSQYALDTAPDGNPNTAQLMTGGNMISAEAMLTTGNWKSHWAPTTVAPSPPLSLIDGSDEGGGGGKPTKIPVCAVFTMDDPGSDKIINLALYFDRWKLANDMWDKQNPQHIDK